MTISSAFFGTTGTKSSVAEAVTWTMLVVSAVAGICGVQPSNARRMRHRSAVSARKWDTVFDIEMLLIGIRLALSRIEGFSRRWRRLYIKSENLWLGGWSIWIKK